MSIWQRVCLRVFLTVWLFLGLGQLNAKEVIIVPYSNQGFNPRDYIASPAIPKKQLSSWQRVDWQLQKKNIRVRTSDLSEFTDLETTRRLTKDTYKIIFNNIPFWTGPQWENILSWIGREKCLIVAWEPPSVMPFMYDPKMLDLFSAILTWDNSYVDNHRFFKMNYPEYKAMLDNLPPYCERKLVTQISGNKHSGHPNELYTERQNVIEYFELHPEFGFEFYGTNWQELGFTTYRGSPSNKLDTLKQYRFSFCYENITNINGYITEKIFDCFAAGCIPIYWGATDIHTYIPKECYIDRTKFSSMKDLAKYLKDMPEKTYNKYINNIKVFLKSRKAKAFSKKQFEKAVMAMIENSVPQQNP